jgi:N-acetylmuramoyl-L-alanine amidase
LASSEGKETIANSIYMGFVDYKKSWDSKNAAQHTPQAAPQPAPQPQGPGLQPGNQPQGPQAGQQPQQPAGRPQGTIYYYKVQFLSSPKQLKQGAPELKGLWPVESYRDGSVYRYTYGKATDKGQLQQTIINVRKKFKDAFVVKFDEQGNRVK